MTSQMCFTLSLFYLLWLGDSVSSSIAKEKLHVCISAKHLLPPLVINFFKLNRGIVAFISEE